jgi:SNF2 family DNA or RNA helicase
VRRFATSNGQLTETVRSEIRNLLSEVMIRNTRALSGVHLPPRFARTLLVQPGPEEHALYDCLVEALRALSATGRARLLLSTLLQEAGSSPQAVRGTLEKVASDEGLPEAVRSGLASAADFARRATGSEKTRALLQALQASPGPTIVFTRFRGTLAFLADALSRAGVRYERLHGEIPAAARAAAIDRCREAGSVLLSTDVGSEGLNLQFCHRLINFDLPWNPMRIEQRIGRLHRIGQEHAVEVLNFCLAGSIEERILGILDERINLFELVVGEVEMILGYLDSPREFPELVLDAFAERDEADRTQSFAHIADALAAARERYRTVKLFDEALFRNEWGV